MSEPLTDRQRRVLDRVESEPADADLDDVETLVEVACRRPEAEGADAHSAIGRVASERPALLADRVDSVLPLFAVDDPNVRWGAASIVATLAKADPERLADTTAVTNLQQAIVDPEGWNRAHAAEMLSEVAIASPELVDDECLPTLARRLESEEFPDARAQIALAFGRIARAEPGLLDDHADYIQAAIEEQLGTDDEIERRSKPQPTRSRRRTRLPRGGPIATPGRRRSARSAERSSRPVRRRTSVETAGRSSESSPEPGYPANRDSRSSISPSLPTYTGVRACRSSASASSNDRRPFEEAPPAASTMYPTG